MKCCRAQQFADRIRSERRDPTRAELVSEFEHFLKCESCRGLILDGAKKATSEDVAFGLEMAPIIMADAELGETVNRVWDEYKESRKNGLH